MPPTIWPASNEKVIGPAPICGISQAMPKTSEAPISPAVRSTGWTVRALAGPPTASR